MAKLFDCITIGTATRDAFIKSDNFHVDPDHHVLGGKALVMALGAKLEVPEIFFSTGGGATNAAVTFARQELKTGCIAAIGEDSAGDVLIHDLKKEGIFTGFMRSVHKPTGYSILLEPPSGERTVLVCRGASESLTSSTIPWNDIRAKWFYISSLGGNIALLRAIVAFAKKNNIRIAYNPGGKELTQKQSLLPLLKHIEVLLVNREEASLITSVSFEDAEKLFLKWDTMSPGINVMTDARNGVWASDGTHMYHAGIFKEKRMQDRTGAGDAFGSGFTSSLVYKPEDIERAIRLGSANATSKVEGMGAKYGLMTKKQFESDKRWRILPITKKSLS